ncbi:hypothetical protein FHR70_003780 [Microvirga lupini]|uniref:Uncharacterized protein n=1 Tax=Microvirga lupini TaxID=420324 RepID=A0A7W4VNZ4_9HYPH|nr:hypothetical protein [Microvirga lupini]MBB3020694.1 hypothetical protein [Microvirga lupini]
MGEVVAFPFRPRVVQPFVAEPVEINATVREIMAEGLCPSCFGRGVKLRPRNLRMLYPSDFETVPCPCGGDDENRIGCDEPDYPGAA